MSADKDVEISVVGDIPTETIKVPKSAIISMRFKKAEAMDFLASNPKLNQFLQRIVRPLYEARKTTKNCVEILNQTDEIFNNVVESGPKDILDYILGELARNEDSIVSFDELPQNVQDETIQKMKENNMELVSDEDFDSYMNESNG